MVLYVTRPPNPSLGEDWVGVVPGQYLYDITGITATLNTANGAGGAMLDSSGFANDGTYDSPANTLYGVPGLVAGDEAITITAAAVGGSMPMTSGLLAGDFWVAGWITTPTSGDCEYILTTWFSATPQLMVAFFYRVQLGVPFVALTRRVGPAGGALETTSRDPGPLAAGAHFLAASWDSALDATTFFVDGVNIGTDTVGAPTGPFGDVATGRVATGSSNFPVTFDEICFGPNQLLDADAAALYAAALVDFPTWTAAVLALFPFGFYHLDEFMLGTGRITAFDVTDGTKVIASIPTGFPQSLSAGPFAYSWQPKLAASSQSASGQTTSIAIPKLVLPAGYTVGSRTLDIATGDQWSDIAIWWDSGLMDATQGPGPYDYPPGAHLRYRQVRDG